MTPRQLHADFESVCDADLLREAMQKSTETPICDQCALAQGAIEPARQIVGISLRSCCICAGERMCTSLRDWRWSSGVWARINRNHLNLETK